MIALLYLSVFLLSLSCLLSVINSPDASTTDIGRSVYGMAVGFALAGVIALAAHGISCVEDPHKKVESPVPAIVKTVLNDSH